MQIQLTQTHSDHGFKNKLALNWLMNNPRKWRGKQVLSRKNGGIYTVRDVMPRGSVELEKKGVLYTSNIETVRQDYEPASP